jgi:hypothetical protein
MNCSPLKYITIISMLAFIGCTRPKQTTAVGAAAGTAIGAGLGAIIGNQTGNAGSGVAIGAAAGAATGTLVANALQAQQESIRSQDEAIERQERLLQVQRSELTELRNINPDLVEQKRIALRKRGPAPTSMRTASLNSQEQPSSATHVRARYNPAAALPKVSSASTSTRRATASNRGADPFNTKTPSPKERTALRVPPKLPSAPAQSDITTAEGSSEELFEPAGLNESDSRSECETAASENRAATAATDPSDKLLHLRKALRLCPSNAELHHELGKVYSTMERTSDAENAFKEALKVDPTFSAAQQSLRSLRSANITQRF